MDKFTKYLSVLGTGSDVGKSIVVAALCRIFNNFGLRVTPFKAQNMSNNSSVTEEGGEMGRAQVVQAQAARIKPHVDMNPVLLKPGSATGSQVVVHGQPIHNVEARDYYKSTDHLFQKSRESLKRLSNKYGLIIMEGAGSCGEVNLMDRDFVNFKIARAANAPVLLVADIDRGGVFAQIIGTLDVIPEEYRQSVQGIIINRFRGDPSLFDDGIAYLEQRTGLPVLGLIPYFTHIKIDSEDSVQLDVQLDPQKRPDTDKVGIAVLRLPHISNFTDFSPLENDPAVDLHYLERPRSLADYRVVVLPGTKNVRNDLEWLERMGWFSLLNDFSRNGGELVGICGGYQMLGQRILDPLGVESAPGTINGLGLLGIETEMESRKTLSRSSGIWQSTGDPVEGYEIHMGTTRSLSDIIPAIKLTQRNGEAVSGYDGAISENGKVWGTYFHGLFNSPEFRWNFLKRLNSDYQPPVEGDSISHIAQFRDQQYDLLADHFKSYLDLEKLVRIAGYAPSQFNLTA